MSEQKNIGVEEVSYRLALTNELSWRLIAYAGTEDWFESMAAILHLRPSSVHASVSIRFVPSLRPRLRFPSWQNLSAFFGTPCGFNKTWDYEELGRVTLWHNAQDTEIICELDLYQASAFDFVLMWDSMHALYRGLVRRGGLPLHSALVKRPEGAGTLLVGGSGVGKSTCCQRLPQHWSALADDGVLVVPVPQGGYTAHPLPTWSDHILQRPTLPCFVERGIPLSSIIFLEQAAKDEILPLGKGTAAVWLTQSARVICDRGRIQSPHAEGGDFNRFLFENACEVVKSVPTFILRVARDGRFWEELERGIPLQVT